MELGETQRLRDVRMFFQYATEVWAFVSGIDVREDVSVEVFYLKPEDEAA